MFIDRAVVRVTAGTGGSGASSFARFKYKPKGGPDGGDGGHGGSVYVRGDANLATLLDYRYRNAWKAERGEHGRGKTQTGASSADVYLPVPPGTVVRDAETAELLGEVLRPGDTIRVAKGGRGGRGNARFATSTHQAPREWEPGEEGEDRSIELVLKLIADVGLVGEPNAGKSTLLSVVSAARPKIADYPFTTLEPNLGVVGSRGHRSFVLADIPGIIEGAHEGKGLGLRFLQHVERTRVLAYLVPLDSPDLDAVYRGLRHEIRAVQRGARRQAARGAPDQARSAAGGRRGPVARRARAGGNSRRLERFGRGAGRGQGVSLEASWNRPKREEGPVEAWREEERGVVEPERAAYVALALTPGIGPSRLQAILDVCHTATGAFSAPFAFLRSIPGISAAAATAIAASGDLASGVRAVEDAERLGGRALIAVDPEYPALLRADSGASAAAVRPRRSRRCWSGLPWRSSGAGITRRMAAEVARALAWGAASAGDRGGERHGARARRGRARGARSTAAAAPSACSATGWASSIRRPTARCISGWRSADCCSPSFRPARGPPRAAFPGGTGSSAGSRG